MLLTIDNCQKCKKLLTVHVDGFKVARIGQLGPCKSGKEIQVSITQSADVEVIEATDNGECTSCGRLTLEPFGTSVMTLQCTSCGSTQPSAAARRRALEELEEPRDRLAYT